MGFNCLYLTVWPCPNHPAEKLTAPGLKLCLSDFPTKFRWEILQLGIGFLGFFWFYRSFKKGLMAAVVLRMGVYSIWIRGNLPIINDVTPTSSPSESNPGRYQRITQPWESTTDNGSLCNQNWGLGNLSQLGYHPPFKCSKWYSWISHVRLTFENV